MLDLQWSEVDLGRRTAWIHGDEAKGGEAIRVPLNDDAMAMLNEEKGKHPDRVFTYKGRPTGQVNTRSWRKCLEARRHQELSLPAKYFETGPIWAEALRKAELPA